MVKSAELKPCYKQAVSETIWVLLSPFENTNLRYIFEFSLSVWLRSMSLCRKYWSRAISWLKWFAWSWQITTLWFSHDWGSFYDLIRKWKKIWGGGGGVPYPNMQLDTEPFKNKSLERSGLFSIISCATDIALAPSATRRVFLKLESRRLNA